MKTSKWAGQKLFQTNNGWDVMLIADTKLNKSNLYVY